MNKNIKQSIQRQSLRLSLFAVAFTMSTAVFAQDDFDDPTEETATVKAPKRQTVTDKNPTVTIEGTVIDLATKKPVAGAKLHVLADERYAGMTKEDGKFSMKVPTFATSLYVSAPRYSAQQVAIKPNDEKQTINISLLSSNFHTMYNDGTTYTAQGSMTSNGRGVTIDEEISAELGADVKSTLRSGQRDGGAAMFIRGLNSLNSNAQPLIIVDGVEIDMMQGRENLHEGQAFNMLANITPDDIDNVTVLKNATALYGSRGGNGVILINTKRGHSMATRIDANISVGWTMIPKLSTVMNSDQYRSYAMQMIGTTDKVLESKNPTDLYEQFNFMNDDPTGYYYKTYHNNTDWSDYVYQKAMTQNYSINVQGGDSNGMYNLSVGYIDAASTAKENDFDRLSVRFNTDIYILEKLSTKFDMSFTRFNNKVMDTSFSSDLSEGTVTSPTALAYIKSPLLSPYQYNQNINDFSSLLSGADETYSLISNNYSLANPVAILENGNGDNKNKNENTFFNVHVSPKYQFNSHLSATTEFSYVLNRNSQRYYRPYEGVPSFTIDEVGTVNAGVGSLFSKESNALSHTYVNYKNDFGPHKLNATAGFRYNYFSYDSNILESQYTSASNDKNPTLTTTGLADVDGANDVWKNMQSYVTADYNFANRYFATVSVLAEANSRFGANCSGLKLFGTHWAIFPSVQLGWVLTNEKWFPKNTVINYLRLNAGFDVSGNDNISNYAARSSFSAVKYGRNVVGAQFTNVGNDEIKWETTQKWNYGLEMNMLDNRFSMKVDWFYNKTMDLLTLQTFKSPISGVNNYWCNGGKLSNKGVEVSLSVKPVVTKDWQLEVGASVGHYKNKILSLPAKSFTDGNKTFSDGTYCSSIYGDNNIITQVGNEAGLFYGYQTAGVFADKNAAASTNTGVSHVNSKGVTTTNLYMIDNTGAKVDFEAGDMHFVDQNGDGVIDENDKVVIGNPNPDIYGNIFAALTWKRFTLNLNFNYSVGNDVYNYQRRILMSGSNLYNQNEEMINRWTYEGQVTDIPRIYAGDPMGNSRFSDRWIEDGSYLRLKSLNLTYRIPIPDSWTAWLQGISVWGECTNLFTLTNYRGSDPEFSNGNGVLYQGIDTGNLPHSRTFTFGLKVNL